MAASGFTPISLYYSTTAAAVPTSGNLANGELGLNIADMKLYAKNSAGTVTLLASNAGASGSVTSVAATVPTFLSIAGSPITSSGTLAITLSGTALPTTSGGTGLTTLTAGYIPFGAGTSAFGNSANLFWDNTNGRLGLGTTTPGGTLDVKGGAAVNNTIYLTNGNAGNYGNIIQARDSAGTLNASLIFSSLDNSILFNQGSSNTERARFDTNGRFGIGTSSPSSFTTFPSKLVVGSGSGTESITIYSGTSSEGNLIFADGTAGTAQYMGLVRYDHADNGMKFYTNGGTLRMTLSSTGGMSVGTASDPGVGAIYATGNITAFFSDKRLKTVSGKIENALDKVAKLSGVYYTFNDTAKSFGYDSDEEQVGVIAQEVEAVLPQIVKAAPFDLDENNNSKSGENYKTVQYDKLVPLLIEAINELQAKVKALETA
jgi:hypothetical protein